jgi:hypothetical protein
LTVRQLISSTICWFGNLVFDILSFDNLVFNILSFDNFATWNSTSHRRT